MMFHKKKPVKTDPKNSESMPPLEAEEEEDLPRRETHGPLWVTVLCVVVAVALLLSSLPTGALSSSTVRSKLLSGTPEEKQLKTVLYGAGTLTPQEGEEVEVPQTLEILERYVHNGDMVRDGDPILKVDKTKVTAAMAELQGLLSDIDKAIVKEGNKNNASSVKATASGRVKKIYAQKDTAVADTMYDKGALMLLSLDGTMAVKIPADGLQLGDSLTVRQAGGKELEADVESIADDIATVTCSDETVAYGETLTVLRGGVTLGIAPAEIHSMLRVTGLNGTVSNVNVKEGRKVNNGTILLTLKDTGKTAEYERLLSRRLELEEHLEKLLKLSQDGVLRADAQGIVTGLDEEVDYVFPETVETRPRSQASPGAPDGTSGETGGTTGKQNPTTPSDPTVPDPTNPTDPTTPTDPTDPTVPPEPEEITFVVGVVVSNEGGDIAYIPCGGFAATREVAEKVNFAAQASAREDQTPTVLSGVGAVYVSDGSSWSESSADSIARGDAILLGGGMVIHQAGGTLIPAAPTDPTTPTTPGLPGGMPSGMFAGMGGMSGMSGMSGMGSMSGLTASVSQQTKTPAYDSFDTTCTVAATITQTEEMTVDITVDELDVLNLEKGMEADITLDALPGQVYPGTVTKINTYGENEGGNTKYTVTVTLPRVEKMLTGMNAAVKIQTAQSPLVPTLPAAAIQSKEGKSWVYTGYDEKTDTLTDLVEVKTGLSDGESVEILSGFPEGGSYYYRYADTIEYQFLG